MDRQIEEVEAPMKQLESDYRAAQDEINTRIKGAQSLYQELSMNMDKLESSNKSIERLDFAIFPPKISPLICRN